MSQEERLQRLEQKIDLLTEELVMIKAMVTDIHKHVGFVDSLSNIYDNIKARGLRTIISTRSLLSWNDDTPSHNALG